MTVPPDRTAHPDLDALADLDEGLLDPAAAAGLGEHLAGCLPCRELRGSLSEVRAQLAALPDPPLPAEVAARLDQALAAEAGHGGERRHEVIPLARRSRRMRTGLLVAGVAAGVVALAVAGGVVLSAGQHDSAGTSAEESAGGAASQSGRAGYRLTASGRDYDTASLGAALPGLLSGKDVRYSRDSTAATSAVPSAQAARGGVLATLADPSTVQACAANLEGPGVLPLAVDVARYRGTPATVLVFATPGKPDKIDVFVVAPGCPAGTFRYFHRYDRP